MLRIRTTQWKKFEEQEEVKFIDSLISVLEQTLPEEVRLMRDNLVDSKYSDPFRNFIRECVQTAEEIEMEDDRDIAVFVSLVLLTEFHADRNEELFNQVFEITSHESAGRSRIALIEDRFADVAESRVEIAPMAEIIRDVAKAFT